MGNMLPEWAIESPLKVHQIISDQVELSCDFQERTGVLFVNQEASAGFPVVEQKQEKRRKSEKENFEACFVFNPEFIFN